MAGSLLAVPDHRAMLLGGLRLTVMLFALSWLLAAGVGCGLAALRDSRLAPVRALTGWIVDYHRNVPGVVQVFVWYFGISTMLPGALQRWINRNDGEFLLACVALALYAAAYVCEDLRSGLRTIPAGQSEAAAALGLSRWQAALRVLLPQAVRAALPALVNQTLALFKATSLAMTIGVVDLLGAAVQIENQTFRVFEVFGIASAGYLAVSWSIMAIGAHLERRFAAAPARR
jgi:polar amino acid transport system permease protein